MVGQSNAQTHRKDLRHSETDILTQHLDNYNQDSLITVLIYSLIYYWNKITVSFLHLKCAPVHWGCSADKKNVFFL